jgi:superoxide reductase
MAEDHYIEWIEVINGERVCRCFLKPGSAPQADFDSAEAGATAREYCNKHGLWKADI